MSVRVMAWVWQHSRSRKMERLVLLAIADCASDDGANAYPSTAELMRKTGLSERGVQATIRSLVALGELAVQRNAGPRGCNRYRVRMTPAESAPPANRAGVDAAPPANPAPAPPQTVRPTPANPAPGTVLEPSIEPSVKPSSSKPKKALAVIDRPDVEQVCRHLADRIEANGSKRPTITQTWRDAARRLIDKDGRTVEQVVKAIDWCQDDQFWRSNIMSMPKLREQYDRLRLAAARTNGRKPSTTDQRVADALAAGERLQAQLARGEIGA